MPEGDDKELKGCNAVTCANNRDCVLDKWSDWSACSCSQDGVTRRSRTIAEYGSGTGSACMGNTKEIESCNLNAHVHLPAPEPCTFSDWSSWSDCSVTCGEGQFHRSREVDDMASHGGALCNGPLAEISRCVKEHCLVTGPKPCLWGDWGEWGACDKCGGQRKRNRVVKRMPEAGGTSCRLGASEETEKCKRQCHEPVYCSWGEWEDESMCSVTCGEGTKKRARYLKTFTAISSLSERPSPMGSTELLYTKFRKSSEEHTRDVVVSFVIGSVVSVAAVMMAVMGGS